MDSENELVTLQMQSSAITCKKSILIQNSDYFRAMFEGNFLESNKNVIKLENVDYRAMELILALISNEQKKIKIEDLLFVLQTTCMLQFLQIKANCIEELSNKLDDFICLKLWFFLEPLHVKPLCLKAKFLAFIHFVAIRKLDVILELDLYEICLYLGSVNLRCNSEYSVFKTAINWFKNNDDKSVSTMLKLLSCINFEYISNDQVKKMLRYYLEINLESDEIVDILSYFSNIKSDGNVSNFSEICIKKATLLSQSRNRVIKQYPCFLVNGCDSDDAIRIIYYDPKDSKMRKLLQTDLTKYIHLDGFQIFGYQHFIYIFGGEYDIGRGKWNSDISRCDVFNNSWQKMSCIKERRRHFQFCICGDNCYAVGGTGAFRVIQGNVACFDLKKNVCEKVVDFPGGNLQLKCCCFEKKLFILYFNHKVGYFFNHSESTWTNIEIVDENDNLPKYSPGIEIFEYNSNLFIKGDVLLEYKLLNNKLRLVKKMDIPKVEYDQLESVLCENILYTLYKQKCEDTYIDLISLEAFNVDTYESRFIFERIPQIGYLEIDGDIFVVKSFLNIFGASHFSLMEENLLINDNFQMDC